MKKINLAKKNKLIGVATFGLVIICFACIFLFNASMIIGVIALMIHLAVHYL